MGFTYSPLSKDDSTISDKALYCLYWNETMVFREYLGDNFEKIVHAIFYRKTLTNIFGLNTGNNFNNEIQLFLT